MNTIVECTLPEKILLAAHQLEEEGQSPFTAESLTVAVWRKYPRTFGLKGFEEQHPDSNKVLASLMGEKGLARRGWLSKVGQKIYSLSHEGRLVVRRLLAAEGDAPPPPPRPVKLPGESDRLLQVLLASTAASKFRAGQQQELKFADACRFWDITEHAGETLDGRLEQMRRSLDEAGRRIGLGTVTLGNGRHVAPEDVGLLHQAHAYMLERFAPHLTLLRKRGERR